MVSSAGEMMIEREEYHRELTVMPAYANRGSFLFVVFPKSGLLNVVAVLNVTFYLSHSVLLFVFCGLYGLSGVPVRTV